LTDDIISSNNESRVSTDIVGLNEGVALGSADGFSVGVDVGSVVGL